VLAFCSATIEDGGTGALYVLLKRQFKHWIYEIVYT
jgi:DNA-nicking Smr family endonuclease